MLDNVQNCGTYVGYSHMDGRQTFVTRIRFIDSVTMVKYTTIKLPLSQTYRSYITFLKERTLYKE
jgi:hypothetical protein